MNWCAQPSTKPFNNNRLEYVAYPNCPSSSGVRALQACSLKRPTKRVPKRQEPSQTHVRVSARAVLFRHLKVTFSKAECNESFISRPTCVNWALVFSMTWTMLLDCISSVKDHNSIAPQAPVQKNRWKSSPDMSEISPIMALRQSRHLVIRNISFAMDEVCIEEKKKGTNEWSFE